MAVLSKYGRGEFCGFSFPELLITFVIITIFSLFAIPSYQTFITKTQDRITSAQLQHAIHLLRSEANSRGIPMTLCASRDQQSCSGNWEDGQIIFVDKNQDGKVSSPEDIIYHFNSRANKDKLHWRSALNHEYLQILPSGLTSGENGTFWNCHPPEKTPTWALIINQAGRARVADNSELNSLVCGVIL